MNHEKKGTKRRLSDAFQAHEYIENNSMDEPSEDFSNEGEDVATDETFATGTKYTIVNGDVRVERFYYKLKRDFPQEKVVDLNPNHELTAKLLQPDNIEQHQKIIQQMREQEDVLMNNVNKL